jgi:hypothetical protein
VVDITSGNNRPFKIFSMILMYGSVLTIFYTQNEQLSMKFFAGMARKRPQTEVKLNDENGCKIT